MEARIIRFKILEEVAGLEHFISTRKGGVSKAPFNYLNFALHVGDKEDSVLRNRQILADKVNISLEKFVLMEQIHSASAHVAKKGDRGKGISSHADSVKDTDALITNEPGVCLAVQAADCVPILLYDAGQCVIAAIHAGWRGTMKGIVQKTVEKMKSEFSCSSQDIVAGIGPSIGPCCYEATDKDLLGKWEGMFQTEDKVVVAKKGKKFLDLWQANKVQLVRSGVEEENIELAEICTSCNTDDFYSYKKESKTGRIVVGIMLEE